MTRPVATAAVAGWLAVLLISATFGVGCGPTRTVTLRERPRAAVAISPDG